jgi:hypothetical protein
MEDWKKTTKRFIAFFDIMGFKDMVERNSHKNVVDKLEKLKHALSVLERKSTHYVIDKNFKSQLTKSITFSDSIIFFSKSNTLEDITKIIIDAAYFQYIALKNDIAIKGVLSYGEITVDFENSLFFGRPIIDAYLLHDQLNMYTAMLDNRFEAELKKKKILDSTKKLLVSDKVFLKNGKICHTVVLPARAQNLNGCIDFLKGYYNNVSGQPRIYVDNTIAFFESIIENQ